MPKLKKSHKFNDSGQESRDENSVSSMDSAGEDMYKKREKKKRKQKDKKKKKHRKIKGTKKKSKHNSEDNSSTSSESSSEENKIIDKKKIKQEEKSALRTYKEKSQSREKEKGSGRSKWESPSRRRRSRSRNRYNSCSLENIKYGRDRSRSRNRERSQEHGYDRDSERRHRTEVKKEHEDRMDYRHRDKEDQRKSYSKKERSPRRERERSREHNRERNYAKREPHSPHRSREGGYRPKHKRKEDNSFEWGKPTDNKKPLDQETSKEKPNFALSGALTEDVNKVNGVVIKYAEPPEARKPKRRWRLYPFKGENALPVLHIHRQSCFLVGRDRKVVDLAVDHPSCSKQHAALQYRLVAFEREDGTQGKRVRLYLIDLDSANGTFLNNKRIDARKYYELMEKDVIKFGFSTREYVLLHENSKEDQEDDDIEVKEEPMDI